MTLSWLTTTVWLWCRANRVNGSCPLRGHEEETRKRLAAGELGLDIYGLREALADKGLRYVDGPVDWRRKTPEDL